MSCCKAVVIGNMLIHFVYLLTVITISHSNKNIKNINFLDNLLVK